MMKTNSILLPLLSLIYCTSLAVVPGRKEELTLPDLSESSLMSSAGNPSKFRRSANEADGFRAAVLNNIAEMKNDRTLFETAVQRILRSIGSSRVQFVFPDAAVMNKLRSDTTGQNEFIKKEKIDAVVSVDFTKKDQNSYDYSVSIRFPDGENKIGEISGKIEILNRKTSGAKRSDIAQVKGQYFFLNEVNSPSLQMNTPSEISVKEFWSALTTGGLSVRSSTPGSDVYLTSADGKKTLLGKTPVNDIRLDQGSYRVDVQRKGFSPVALEANVIPGENVSLYVPWPDDPYTTSLALWTVPESLRVSFDGENMGESPVFLSEIEGGRYEMELSYQKSKGNYKRIAKTPVTIPQGRVTRLVYFWNYKEMFGTELSARGYWKKINTGDQPKMEYKDGLRVTSNAANQFSGYKSIPFPTSSFRARVVFEKNESSEVFLGLSSSGDSALAKYNSNGFSGGILAPGVKTVAEDLFLTSKKQNQNVIEIRYDAKNAVLSFRSDGAAAKSFSFKPNSFSEIFFGGSGDVLFKEFDMHLEN